MTYLEGTRQLQNTYSLQVVCSIYQSDHMLGHNASVHKFQKTEIIQSIF